MLFSFIPWQTSSSFSISFARRSLDAPCTSTTSDNSWWVQIDLRRSYRRGNGQWTVKDRLRLHLFFGDVKSQRKNFEIIFGVLNWVFDVIYHCVSKVICKKSNWSGRDVFVVSKWDPSPALACRRKTVLLIERIKSDYLSCAVWTFVFVSPE